MSEWYEGDNGGGNWGAPSHEAQSYGGRGRGFSQRGGQYGGRGGGRSDMNGDWRSNQGWSNNPVQSAEYRNSNFGNGNYRGGRGGGFGGSGGFGNRDDGQSTVINVQNKDVGKIIGKGGSKIREIQDSTGARVNILKDEAGVYETPVRISGDEAAQKGAEEMIREIMESGGWGGAGGGGGGQYRRDDDFTCIMVQSSDCGKIIGKGGSKIREIQDESGARIKVCKDEDHGYETPVKIFGSEESRERAKHIILELTEQV